LHYNNLESYPSAFAEGFYFIKEVFMENRVGVVAIVVEDLKSAPNVNEILHEYSSLIVGRMGIPYKEKQISVISVIVDGTTDEISALTGKLGKIKAVNVKSAITKK
jgi:putative iron-only hydrogenase system regulator